MQTSTESDGRFCTVWLTPRRASQRARRARTAPIAVAGAIAGVVAMALVGPAIAQPLVVDEPTGGVYLPAAPLAGEHDIFSASVNPAGLRFLSGTHLGVAIGADEEDRASQAGPGVGLYSSLGLGSLGGLGFGLEFLRPSRGRLSPDPGSPTRLSLAYAAALGRSASLGLGWHRFFDDEGTATSGLSTWDIGLSMRVGARWAFGAVVRDLTSPKLVTGGAIERRYEAELVSRPVATDRLELGLGGRIGEQTGDFDGWLRLSARLARGLYLKAEVSARELRLVDPADPTIETTERELRATAGFEISLGSVGVAGYATGVRDADSVRGPDSSNRLASGTVLLRASTERVPSILGRSKHIERIELKGGLSQRQLTRLVLRLRAIERDSTVVAVFVQIDGVGAGWAGVEEIRRSLLRLRERGVRVFAYMVAGTTRDYYLASAADKIYLDPAGGLRLTGMAATSIYYKGVFDKLGVSPEFIKIEEYKSAPEQYTRQGPTEPAMRMRNELYDSIFDHVIAGIAKARGLDEATVRKLVDAGPYTAGDLDKEKQLIDAVGEPDAIQKKVFEELGGAYPVGGPASERPDRWDYPAVAIIYIEGDIVTGESQTIPLINRRLVGGETIVQAIAAARADSRVKAIVLRIDSPGGSAVASELMSREVFQTRGVKPIICSMSDLAASGGYFAAAGCERIFAEPTTITGSIGIFYGKFDVSALAARLGLSWQVYKRGEHADMESMFRPFTSEERVIVLDKMKYLYDRFIGTVSKGRGISTEEVDDVGRGRVWSGSDALSRKLVDELGGLGEAITYAKARAGFGDDDLVRIVELPTVERSLIARLLGLPFLRGASGEAGAGNPRGLDALLAVPGMSAVLEAIPGSLWAEPDAPQARLPFTIRWD